MEADGETSERTIVTNNNYTCNKILTQPFKNNVQSKRKPNINYKFKKNYNTYLVFL